MYIWTTIGWSNHEPSRIQLVTTKKQASDRVMREMARMKMKSRRD